MDLDRYFARIGYGGGTARTLDVLAGVVAAHARAVPFENCDVLLGRPIRIDPASLERKIVSEVRGGYCFEQNGLLLEVLSALGFDAAPRSARVRVAAASRDVLPPRTHVFLEVALDGARWIADVGIGGLTPAGLVRIEYDVPQPTTHETHRLVREEGRSFLQALIEPESGAAIEPVWKDVYEFSGEAMPQIDRELANWWTSTSPTSKFRNNLLVAIVNDDGTRCTIDNDRFVHRRRGTVLEERRIATPEELLELLATRFRLELPPGTRLASVGAAPAHWPR
jgi:N-hydroxyarylamine O-acetyltransferase